MTYYTECLYVCSAATNFCVYPIATTMATFSMNSLCTPAYVYLVVSIFFTVLAVIISSSIKDRLCYGHYCGFENFSIMIFIHFLWVVLWTWVLNMICKVSVMASWFLVLLPYAFMMISGVATIGILANMPAVKQGFTTDMSQIVNTAVGIAKSSPM